MVDEMKDFEEKPGDMRVAFGLSRNNGRRTLWEKVVDATYGRYRWWRLWRRIPELKNDLEEDSFWVGPSESE